MNPSEARHRNQAAFRQLRELIKQTYPAGQFIAIADGKILEDAASFADLEAKLRDSKEDNADVLVVQAGIEYPESVVIFHFGPV